MVGSTELELELEPFSYLINFGITLQDASIASTCLAPLEQGASGSGAKSTTDTGEPVNQDDQPQASGLKWSYNVSCIYSKSVNIDPNQKGSKSF